jgi:predicted SAM-dependent methyltransferase
MFDKGETKVTQNKKTPTAINDSRSTAVDNEVANVKAAPTKSTLNEYLNSLTRDRWSWLRWRLSLSATTIVAPSQKRKAHQRFYAQPIRLHLGCGPCYKEGWVNIDLAQLTPKSVQAWIARKRAGERQRLDLMWDLSRGLPFPDNSVEAIFSEHVLEHFDYGAGLALIKECYRVLKPGGVLRTGVPDLERYIHSYDGDDPIIDDVRPFRPTRAIALSEIFFHHGHRAMYDYETMELTCHEAGFSIVEHSAYAQGCLGAEVDSETRKLETLYVEATK